jgi:hypothetical protein
MLRFSLSADRLPAHCAAGPSKASPCEQQHCCAAGPKRPAPLCSAAASPLVVSVFSILQFHALCCCSAHNPLAAVTYCLHTMTGHEFSYLSTSPKVFFPYVCLRGNVQSVCVQVSCKGPSHCPDSFAIRLSRLPAATV